MENAVEVVVKGRVQGIGFRHAAHGEARRLGLDGWVRNEPDGSVRARVQGRAELVERLAEWLRHGPSGAVVAGYFRQEVPIEAELHGFSIRH